MKQYRVGYVEGETKKWDDVTAEWHEITDGVLLFFVEGEVVQAYAPGAWNLFIRVTPVK